MAVASMATSSMLAQRRQRRPKKKVVKRLKNGTSGPKQGSGATTENAIT